MIWKPGLILRINNYKFEDDGTAKDKYSIILHTNQSDAYLIHSLTTSQNNHGYPDQSYGCSVYKNNPYYFIPRNQIIGDRDFFFEKDTFIFFYNNVRRENFEKFNKAAVNFGIAALGNLSNEELKRLLKCVLKSKAVPKNIAEELSVFKAQL